MYIPRLLDQKVLESLDNRKVLFVLGARQVGKTTLILNLLKKEKGVLLNLDIEVDKARLISAASLSPKEAIRSLGGERLLVIDEAHHFPRVGQIVKGWYDSHLPLKIILLGSSSLNLLDKAAESLAGRNEKLFLTPLLWQEVLAIQDWYNPLWDKDRLAQDFKNQLQAFVLNLLVFGSYPEAHTSEKKETYLFNLVADYLLKDVLHPELVKSPDVVKRLLLLLAYQTGSEVPTTELASSLGSSRQTVERYLDLLERTFVIFRLPSFSTNPRKEIAKGKKIYFWDTGVRNALLKEFSLSELRTDIGPLWENWVISELSKKNITLGLYQDLYFWRTRDGSEVDLVIKDKNGLSAFEIKWSGRERRPKESFSHRYGVGVGTINRENFLFYL